MPDAPTTSGTASSGTATSTTATSTTAGAREHARAQEAAAAAADRESPGAVRAAPTVPASRWPSPPDGVAASALTWAVVVAGGGYAHRRLARGTVLRLTDLEGAACAHLALFVADAPWERLSTADTTKVQWQVHLGAGRLLLSDQGRVLASVTEDTSGHHDALFGTSALARNTARYGDGRPYGPSPAGRELLAVAAAKEGLGRRDLPQTASFFHGVEVDAAGTARSTGSAGPGASVTLRAEVPLVVLIANTAHPLDPAERYRCTPLEVLARPDRPTGPDDPLWDATPEGRRAFEATADHLAAAGRA